MNDLDEEVFSTAQSIIEYLKNNPDAKDNLKGIAKWWVHKDTDIVKKALNYLETGRRIIKYNKKKKLYSRK